MEIYQEIREYVAFNLQESKDKELILTYMRLFNNLLTRENQVVHFTSSAFIVNQTGTKTLFIYHKLYDTWSWSGGHVDGETDFLAVAQREAREETGLEILKPLSNRIASLDILPVFGHLKHGQWIPSHLHLSVAYLFEGDDRAELVINEQETKGVKWLKFSEIDTMSQEPALISIYQKLITKMLKLKDN